MILNQHRLRKINRIKNGKLVESKNVFGNTGTIHDVKDILSDKYLDSLHLILDDDDVDALGVRRQRREQPRQRVQGQSPGLLHHQRVLVEGLLGVGQKRGCVVPDEVEVGELLLVPHQRRVDVVDGADLERNSRSKIRWQGQ